MRLHPSSSPKGTEAAQSAGRETRADGASSGSKSFQTLSAAAGKLFGRGKPPKSTQSPPPLQQFQKQQMRWGEETPISDTRYQQAISKSASRMATSNSAIPTKLDNQIKNSPPQSVRDTRRSINALPGDLTNHQKAAEALKSEFFKANPHGDFQPGHIAIDSKGNRQTSMENAAIVFHHDGCETGKTTANQLADSGKKDTAGKDSPYSALIDRASHGQGGSVAVIVADNPARGTNLKLAGKPSLIVIDKNLTAQQKKNTLIYEMSNASRDVAQHITESDIADNFRSGQKPAISLDKATGAERVLKLGPFNDAHILAKRTEIEESKTDVEYNGIKNHLGETDDLHANGPTEENLLKSAVVGHSANYLLGYNGVAAQGKSDATKTEADSILKLPLLEKDDIFAAEKKTETIYRDGHATPALLAACLQTDFRSQIRRMGLTNENLHNYIEQQKSSKPRMPTEQEMKAITRARDMTAQSADPDQKHMLDQVIHSMFPELQA